MEVPHWCVSWDFRRGHCPPNVWKSNQRYYSGQAPHAVSNMGNNSLFHFDLSVCICFYVICSSGNRLMNKTTRKISLWPGYSLIPLPFFSALTVCLCSSMAKTISVLAALFQWLFLIVSQRCSSKPGTDSSDFATKLLCISLLTLCEPLQVMQMYAHVFLIVELFVCGIFMQYYMSGSSVVLSQNNHRHR